MRMILASLALAGCVELDGAPDPIWSHDRLYDVRPTAADTSRLTVWSTGEHCYVSDGRDGDYSRKLVGVPADGFDPWLHSRRDDSCVFDWSYKR
jgi:hypothetical protein